MTKKLEGTTYEERQKMPGLTLYEKLYGRTEEEIRNKLIHTLHEHGISYIEAIYYGGHDEGGVQELTARDKDGNDIETGGTWEDPVWEACNDVLSTKYFTWALGCSVEGTLYVDMQQRKVWTESSIEEMVTDKEPIEWTL
jgi:hypothetical protein